MTDSSYKARGNGERPVQTEDDPLMQLSQIGGFDDLFSAQSKNLDTTPPSDDMFAIDLERELAGGLDDDFFGQDVPDVFAEAVSPEPESAPAQTPATAASTMAADNYRDSYRSASARSYASYNQGSHGYGSLTQHLQSQPASTVRVEEPVAASQPEADVPYSYAEHGFNADLENELASALSGHEDVLTSHSYYREEESADLQAYEDEPQYAEAEAETYEAPEPVKPALSLEDELANLLFGDEVPAAAAEPAPVYEPETYQAAYEPAFEDVYEAPAPVYDAREEELSQSFDDVFEAYEAPESPESPESGENYEAEQNIDDFAAQSSIEGGNYQPVFTQSTYDEPSFAEAPSFVTPSYDAEEQVQAAPHSNEAPPQDMFFDDTSFAVEPSDIELNALNQASAEFEATLADLPEEDAFDLDDENFSEAIERELSAQNYFAWEKDKVQPEEAAEDGEADNFFSDQDFDFSLDAEAPTSQAAEKPLTFAHAISEEERKPAPFPHYAAQRSSFTAPAPDVATMSVSEAKVEQTQPLDLPEVPYYDEPENAGLNQLEAEFADVFSAISVEETQQSVNEEAASADRAFEDIFRETYADFAPAATIGAAAGVAAGAATAGVSARRQGEAPSASAGNQDDFYNHWADGNKDGESSAPAAPSYGVGEDLGAAAAAYRERPVRGRRGMLLATAAGALVLIGGIAYHFMGGGITSGDPVIIRSDNQPVKMQPENPGGATVPNQDKAVYERVAGTIPQNPEQKSLVSAQENPVDLAATEDEFGSIDEERNDTIMATDNNAPAEDAPLIASRPVQTMVVRPDGTIVPNSVETPRPVTPVAPEAEELTPENIIEAAPLTPAEASNPQPSAPVAPARPVETQTFTPPVAPSRPAQQPANNTGTATAPQAPAASESASPVVAAAPAAGGYYIQIASQPSAELAQKSFATMGQKYASVIGGRAVDIRKADIPGKGTYYRVRIAAGSKNDANALCERLKSAGGSCFVTQ